MNIIEKIKAADLFNRQILLLWQGQFISKLGTYLFDIAIILWVKENSSSAGLIALILIAGSLPEILLSPIGGTLADIFSRRKILIYSDLFAGFIVICFGLIVLFNPFSMTFNYISLLIVAAGLGTCASCFNPSVSALIPEFVSDKKLHSANALFQSTGQVTMVTGQGIGGMLFSILGAPILFFVNGISFFFSAIFESFIKTNDARENNTINLRAAYNKIKSDFIEGYYYCWKDLRLRYFLLIIGLYHFFISPLPVLLPFLVSDTLHLSNEWLGFLLAGFALGTLAGFTTAGIIKVDDKKSGIFIVSLFLISSSLFIILGITDSILICLLSLFFLGSIIGMVVVTLITLMQKIAHSNMRGRLFGFLSTLTNSTIPIGLGIYGLLIDILRIQIGVTGIIPKVVFIINGCCIFILLFLIIIKPDSRKMLLSLRNIVESMD